MQTGWTDVRLLKRGCASKAQNVLKILGSSANSTKFKPVVDRGKCLRGKNKNYQKMGIKYF